MPSLTGAGRVLQGDRLYNDAGAYIAAQTTWSYLLQGLLQRRTVRRLYAEMLEYTRVVEVRDRGLGYVVSIYLWLDSY